MSNIKPLIFLWLFFHLFAVVVFIIRHENAAKIDTNFLSITPKFLEDKDFQKPLEDFFLKNCGFFDEFTPYGTRFESTAAGTQPEIDFEALQAL